MNTLRLGGPTSSLASAGFIVSSNGSAKDTPDALKKVRRSSGVVMFGESFGCVAENQRRWVSFVPKHLALDNLVNDRANWELVVTCLFHNAIDLLPVGKLNFGSCCVDDQLRDEVAGDLFLLLEQDFFEVVDPLKWPAVGGHSTRVDLTINDVLVDRTSLKFTLWAITFSNRPVSGPESPNHVKALQRKAWRVDKAVAARARLQIAMGLERLTNCCRSARIRFYRTNVGWRGTGWLSEQFGQHKATPVDGRGYGSIGRDLKNNSVSQNAAARTVLGQLHFPIILTPDAWNAVVFGESAIDKGEVGVNQILDAEIVLDQLLKEQLCFQ